MSGNERSNTGLGCPSCAGLFSFLMADMGKDAACGRSDPGLGTALSNALASVVFERGAESLALLPLSRENLLSVLVVVVAGCAMSKLPLRDMSIDAEPREEFESCPSERVRRAANRFQRDAARTALTI